jgi:hypothetical protein
MSIILMLVVLLVLGAGQTWTASTRPRVDAR